MVGKRSRSLKPLGSSAATHNPGPQKGPDLGGSPANKWPARSGPGWIKAPREARRGGWIGEGRVAFQLDSDHAGLTREQIGIGRRTKALGRRVEPPERALSPLRSGMLLGFGWVGGWTVHLGCAPYVRFGGSLDGRSKPAGVPMRVAG